MVKKRSQDDKYGYKGKHVIAELVCPTSNNLFYNNEMFQMSVH